MDVNSWFPEDGISFEVWKEWREGVLNPSLLDEPKESEWVNYYVGVDLGMKRDPSTVVVVELRETPGGTYYHYVRFLKRLTLRMLYSNVAATLAKLDGQLRAKASALGKKVDIVYVLDATGVGEGVCELVEKKLPHADVYRVYLTGGISPVIDHASREIRLPKNQLVSTLLAVFDSDHIYISSHAKEIAAMIEELDNFEIRISDEGRDQFGAKTGSHDDLVCALGIACYCGERFGTRTLKVW
ncbi:MAG: phage terminase large subunit family protein [Halobacteriota archaeon]